MRFIGSGRKRGRAAVCAAAGMLALGVAACGSDDSGSGGGGDEGDKGPIIIGLAVAKTGPLSPYDLEPGNSLLLRIKEINAAGGVNGRKIEGRWIDTKSDKTLAASVATELMSDGAVAIITTCDFDYGSPAAFAAQAKKVPAISLCASSPKNATPSIIGEYGFSMGTGSDTEGVSAAEWISENKKDWKKAYVLRDTSLEYSMATADYFKARWKELGGEIVGEDEFVGGENTDIAAQATRARSAGRDADFIYVGSWNPAGSTAARQLRSRGIDVPIVGNQSSDGLLTKQVAGKITDYYSTPLACMPSYCDGEGPNQEAVDEFAASYKSEYGKELSSSYPINGYDLGTVLQKAIETAGSTEPAEIAKAIETMGPVEGITSSFQFTEKCHRPVGQNRIMLRWVNGQGKYVDTMAASDIPDIGDSNPCAGPQETAEEPAE